MIENFRLILTPENSFFHLLIILSNRSIAFHNWIHRVVRRKTFFEIRRFASNIWLFVFHRQGFCWHTADRGARSRCHLCLCRQIINDDCPASLPQAISMNGVIDSTLAKSVPISDTLRRPIVIRKWRSPRNFAIERLFVCEKNRMIHNS